MDAPGSGTSQTLYPIAAISPAPLSFAHTSCAEIPLSTEATTAIRAEIPAQLEWLGAIEAALSDLRQRGVDDPALAEAATIAALLRTAIGAPAASAPTTALWLSLYSYVSIPFLKHFGSAVGADLGHATAHKIIEVLSNLSNYLKL